MISTVKGMKIGIASILALIILLSLILKCISFYLKSLSRDILNLYEKIPEETILRQIDKYKELKTISEYIGEKPKLEPNE